MRWIALAFLLLAAACAVRGPVPIAPSQVRGLQEQGAALIDVHVPEQEHIPGTDFVIPYTDIAAIEAAVPKERPVILYCRSGHMSAEAAAKLVKDGYTVYDLQGGENAWKAAGYEVQGKA